VTELLVIVPARAGSKRLPGKNSRALAGKTLMARTADAMAAAGISGSCLLSTDDDVIAREGERLGWLVPFRRPAALAADDTPTVPVVLHALDWFRGQHGGDPELTLVLQLTSPLRGGVCISRAIAMLRARADADAVIAMARLDRAPRHIVSVDRDGFAAPLAETDTPRPLATPNGALYLIRTAALRSAGTLMPKHTLPLLMDAVGSLDIDDAMDWALAEAAAQAGLEGGILETGRA
jgi:CMP-N,N'-diacetyllegionaminic acid synthase